MSAALLAAEEEEQAQLDATGLMHGAFRGGLAGAMVCLARADHLRLAESCRILRRWTTPFVRAWTAHPRGGIRGPPVAQIAARFPMVTSVDLARCKEITDASVTALAAGCPQLTSVNLTACRQITGASVAALRSQIPGVNVEC